MRVAQNSSLRPHKNSSLRPHTLVAEGLIRQVAGLRQEITALSRFANASRGDEVVLLLNTGGGTVLFFSTGYGLAAAQLIH